MFVSQELTNTLVLVWCSVLLAGFVCRCWQGLLKLPVVSVLSWTLPFTLWSPISFSLPYENIKEDECHPLMQTAYDKVTVSKYSLGGIMHVVPVGISADNKVFSSVMMASLTSAKPSYLPSVGRSFWLMSLTVLVSSFGKTNLLFGTKKCTQTPMFETWTSE